MATNKTISSVLKIILAAYPRFEISEETVRVWGMFMADLDDELLQAAVARFISSSDHAFPPSIPELRHQATEIRREIAGVPLAFEAWEEVLKAPTPSPYRPFRDGQFQEPDQYQWSHEAVALVAKRLGWGKGFPGSNIEADRAHFLKAYDAEVNKRLRAQTQIPQVTTYIEAERNKHLLDVSGEIKQLATEKRLS